MAKCSYPFVESASCHGLLALGSESVLTWIMLFANLCNARELCNPALIVSVWMVFLVLAGKPGKNCSTDGLIGITNPRRLPHGDFQLAIYDRKTDNYECCPTFNYQVAAPYNTTRRRHRNRLAVRRAARRAA